MAVAELGYIIDSSGAVVAADNLDDMAAAAKRAEVGAKGVGAAAGVAAKQTGLASHQSRMMAMQLSQVAQQASATGQWVQALAIQLPDMALGFGTIGIAAGVLAGATLPMLVASITGTADNAKELNDAVDALNDTLGETEKYADIAAGSFGGLRDVYGEITPAILRLVEAQAQIDLRGLSEQANELTATLVAMYNGNAWLNVSRAEDLSNALNLGTNASRDLVAAIKELSGAGSLDQQVAAATALKNRFIEIVGPVGQMTKSQFEYYTSIVSSESALRQARDRAEEMADSTNAADSAADRLTQSMKNAYALYAQTRNMATELANETQRAAAAFVDSMQSGGTGDLAAQYAQYGAGRAAFDKAAQGTAEWSGLMTPVRGVAAASSGGGGGGVSAVDQYAEDIDALVTSLQTERETIDAWYAEGQALLDTQRSIELLGVQGHNDAKLALEAEYSSRLVFQINQP
jgi:hypothetical protein